jgi:hypothetical protein
MMRYGKSAGRHVEPTHVTRGAPLSPPAAFTLWDHDPHLSAQGVDIQAEVALHYRHICLADPD